MVFFYNRGTVVFYRRVSIPGGDRRGSFRQRQRVREGDGTVLHQALYRKWRPRTFDEVCGQEPVTSILKYECQTGRFSHAYLFCGSRGTGKTSCAKILAKAVNCEHPTPAGPCCTCRSCLSIDAGSTTDVLEMDAASNNGVDDIRDIRDEVIYTPSELKYRVYIIDEVHMLSTSAFNALLKTLEEPPEHVIFILATTEMQKLPATIISRCQRFDFRRIATEVLSARLSFIADREQITLEPEAARLIARQAQGGMRDAISLLELCAGSRLPITPDLVTATIGTTGREGMTRIVSAIAARDYDTLFDAIDDMVRSSRDLAVFWQELISYYRDMLVVKTTKNPTRYLDLTDSEAAALSSLATRFTRETLLFQIGLLEDALFAMQKAYAVKRTVAEITLTRLCDPRLDSSTEAILARLSRLEEQMAAGIPIGSPVPCGGDMPAPDQGELSGPTEAPMPADVPVGATGTQGTGAMQTAAPSARSDSPSAPEQRSAPTAPAPSASPAPMENRRVLRPLRVYTEVIERVRSSDPMMASFFNQAKAFTVEDGRILLRFPGEFVMNMAREGNGTEIIRKALSVCLDRPVPPDGILYETEETVAESSLIDLIIDAVEKES